MSMQKSSPGRTSVAPPEDFAGFLDKLLAQPRIAELGIDSRPALIRIIIKILDARFQKLPNYKRTKKDVRKVTTIDIPPNERDIVEKISTSPIGDELWLPHASGVLGGALKTLLRSTDPEFREAESFLKITIDDIVDFVKSDSITSLR
jgi:hypothetical protein